jgi:hypothetical protein
MIRETKKFIFICVLFDIVCYMYVEEICLWSSILQPLLKDWFWLLGCAVKIEPPAKLASMPHAVSGLSVLQTTFTAPSFRASVEDALAIVSTNYGAVCSDTCLKGNKMWKLNTEPF